LLSLLEYDSRIKYQIAELQNGHKQNYGGLVATSTYIKQALQSFSDSHSATSRGGKQTTDSRLQQLQQAFQDKLATLEYFKRENAVLRNTHRYLPRLIQQTIDKLTASRTLTNAHKVNLKALLNLILIDTLIASSQSGLDSQQLAINLQIYHNELDIITPDPYSSDIKKISDHTQQLRTSYKLTSSYVTDLLSSAAADITKSLLQEFNLEYQSAKTTANVYRLWLLCVSLLLLIYLAMIFFKLQAISDNLKQTNIDLEFHKHAIDEHSIVSITDVKGNILYANKKFCEISQYSQDELIGKNHRIVCSGLHDDSYYKSMWIAVARGGKWKGDFANRAKDGSIYWVDSTIMARLNSKGKPYQYIGIRTDITAKKEAEERAELLARFPSENPDPVLRINEQGQIAYANPASKIILDHWKIAAYDRLPDEWFDISRRCLKENQHEEHEVAIGDVHFSILFSPVLKEKYINLYARNITDIKRAEQSLSFQATHDPLTSLTNRYAFEIELDDSLQKAKTKGVNSILLYIDLDQFKIVNDTCGHVAGDELLRQIAVNFSTEIRDSDTLARLGGDEFGIILNNCDLEHGKLIADKILGNIRDYRFLWADNTFEVGASIGLVEITRESESTTSLLGEADIACYAAKDAGRNQLKIYQQDKAISQRRDEMQWANIIPKSLKENQFTLYAQLIKPLQPSLTNQAHYEVLIRLKNDQGEIIPPGAFIPAAERYGLMSAIDIWVINNACEMLGQYNRRCPETPLSIAINLSGQSIGDENLLNLIPNVFELHTIDAALITFEITETAAITNLTSAISFIKKLKALGCKFALDDFGSGLSSFAYLKNLPVDYLKIDGAFVKDILIDPIDAAMVQSINQIGHVMNIQTIAEFVESKQIEERLCEMKVDFVQGYGVEKPRPFSDIALPFASPERP
ncbi:MAG: EAL domain-containing protein, partial [Chloroflexi bacterium]|nr:EAL domain-containing protein [Chloroflexota bacterium]